MAHPALEREIWGYRNFNYGANNIRLMDFSESCRKGTTYDYLFIGGSTTYRSVNPRMLEPHGIEAFNLGSSSQPLRNSYRLLQWAFKHPCHFKEVHLGLDKNALTSDGYESTMEFIMNNNQAIDAEFGLMAVDYGDPYTVLTWIFYGLRRQLRPAILSPPGSDVYIDGGFVFANEEPAAYFDCETKSLGILARTSISHYPDPRVMRSKPNRIQPDSFLRHLAKSHGPYASRMQSLTLDGNDWLGSKVDSMYYDEVHLTGRSGKFLLRLVGSRIETPPCREVITN